MSGMLIRLYQVAIILGVMFAFIYFDIQAEGYAGGAVAIFTAYALSVWPIKFYDWLKYSGNYRAARRAESRGLNLGMKRLKRLTRSKAVTRIGADG